MIAGCSPLAERQLTVELVGGVKGVALLGIHYSQGYFDVGPLEGASNIWGWGGWGGVHVWAGEQILC